MTPRISSKGGLSLIEAKQWDADFTKRFSENRPYYNASQQIRRYLDKTPSNIEWGILTNGRKWRLYGIKDREAQIYYEVDLPELIEDGESGPVQILLSVFPSRSLPYHLWVDVSRQRVVGK